LQVTKEELKRQFKLKQRLATLNYDQLRSSNTEFNYMLNIICDHAIGHLTL